MNTKTRIVMALAAAPALAVPALAGPPEFAIVDLGIVEVGDFSQAFSMSPGGVATGRSLGSGSKGFSWTEGGGFVALPNLASPVRDFGVANGANDVGVVVGTGAQTFFGSSPLPLIWESGVVTQLSLPAGQTLGRANDINDAGVAVGSAGGGSLERGVIYTGGAGAIITVTTSGGSSMGTAYAINNAGLVCGSGGDPNNAAVTVGIAYDSVADTAVSVGALTGLGHNSAIPFAISDAGHVVGSSSLNSGSGSRPFIWTQGGGMTEIPLPAGTGQGSARGVNSSGCVVGTASNAFAIPFFYDGVTTHALADLLPAGSGWDLSTNTSSSALGISDDGIIVGAGVHNGEVRAYAMIPASAGCSPADLAEPFGALDFSDVVAFLTAFSMGDSEADLAAPFGSFDFSDVVAFLTAFGAGCP